MAVLILSSVVAAQGIEEVEDTSVVNEGVDQYDYGMAGQDANRNLTGYSAFRVGGDISLNSKDVFGAISFEKSIGHYSVGIGFVGFGNTDADENGDVNEGDADKDDADEGDAGVFLRVGYYDYGTWLGWSSWTGIAVMPASKDAKVHVPIMLEGNFRFFSLIGWYVEAGAMLNSNLTANPVIGTGFMFLPTQTFDFGGFQ